MNEIFISPNNLARLADVVFAETVDTKVFQNSNNINKKVVNISKNKESEFITYKLNKFTLKENDLIYCHTEFIDELFMLLKSEKNLKNIKLITHQSDKTLTSKQIKKKPECISNWLSLNLGIVSENVEPIPFGLSNKMSQKNLSQIEEIPKELNLENKEDKLYLNFQKNTNRDERENLYEYFSKDDWAVIKDPNLSLDVYKKDLINFTFILCPWGNGYDTNRLWEALYFGCIVITKKHPTFSNLNDLPIIQVDSYYDIDLQFLKESKKNIKNKIINYDKLRALWWINYIKENKVSGNKSVVEIKQNLIFSLLYIIKWRTINMIESKNKKLVYFFYRLKKYLARSNNNEL